MKLNLSTSALLVVFHSKQQNQTHWLAVFFWTGYSFSLSFDGIRVFLFCSCSLVCFTKHKGIFFFIVLSYFSFFISIS